MESSKPHSAAIHPAREYDDVPEQLALDQKGSTDSSALRRVAAAEISHPQDAALVADIRVLETPFEIASHPAAHQGV